MANITINQVKKYILAHETGSYSNMDEARNYLAASVRYVLGGGNPYDSIRAPYSDKELAAHAARLVGRAVKASDEPQMPPFHFIGLIADEIRRDTGIISRDVDEYLNAAGISHGTIGRLMLAEIIEQMIGGVSSVSSAIPYLHETCGISDRGVRQACSVALNRCKNGAIAEFVEAAVRKIAKMRKAGGAEKLPRGPIGQIHNVMLSLGFDPYSEGFEMLRYAVYAALSLDQKNRRPYLKDIYAKVSAKYEMVGYRCKSRMDAAVRSAKIGGTSSHAIFRIYNILRPMYQPEYQVTDEVLLEHGFQTKMNRKGYEVVRTAVAIMSRQGIQETISGAALYRLADEELGLKHGFSYCYARFIMRDLKEFQMMDCNVLAFTKKLAAAVRNKMAEYSDAAIA